MASHISKANAVADRGSEFGKIVRLEQTIEAGTGQALILGFRLQVEFQPDKFAQIR